MQNFNNSSHCPWAKRIIAVLLMVLIAVSGMLAGASSAESTSGPSKALLEAMLTGDRYWVLETLVGDNYSNNPQAKANYLNNSDSMMKEALDGYNNADGTAYGAIYKGMVDVLEKKVNADLYVQSFFDSVAEVWNENVLALFGTGDNFMRVADDLSGSLDELQYESILKAALAADYTSSLGVTLGESESSYANIRQLQKALNSVNGWISYLRSKNKYAVGSTEYQSIETYVNDCLIPYSDAVNKYLTSVSSMASEPNEFAQKYLTDIAGTMLIMCEYEMHQGDDWLNYSFSADMAQYFADSGFMDVLKGAGKTLELGSMAIDNYIYLNMIQAQKETLTGPLNRISASTSDEDLAKVMTRFSELAAAQADEQMIAYETVRDYVRQNNVAGEYASDAVKSLAKKLFNISDNAALIKTLAKIGVIVDIATWGAEKAVNVETTAKLTYELKYLDKIITECINQYTRDLSAYNSNKTEANAERVLDDLLLLQKFRLRGETIAYNMSSGQFDSWIGKLFTTESDIENYNARYQKHIDVLIAASVTPVSSNLITVNSGEELSLIYDSDMGWYGNYKNSSGETIQFGDAVAVMCNGVTLNGGTLNIYNTSGASFSLPCISSSGDSTINISGGDFYLYELKNSDTVSVTLKNNSVLHINGMLYTSGSLNFTSSYPVEVNDAELYGSVTGAMLKISGDSTFGGGAEIVSVDFCGSEQQTVNGNNGYVGSLSLTNSNLVGITVNSNLNVRYSVYNNSAAVQRGRNITLLSTGGISGNYFNSDITLDNVTLNNNMLFGGSVYTKGNFTANGTVSINGSYIEADSSNYVYHTFADPNITVKGDVYLQDASLSGIENFNIGGDFEIQSLSTDRKVNIAVGENVNGGYCDLDIMLTLNGKSAQKIENITVPTLVLDNEDGFTVTGGVTVTQTATNKSGEIKNGENLTLVAGAVISENIWRGSLSVYDWTKETPSQILGDLNVISSEDGCNINGSLEIKGDLNSNAVVNLNNVTVDVGKSVNAKATVNMTESQLYVEKNIFIPDYNINVDGINADGDCTVMVGNDICADISGIKQISVKGDAECSGDAETFILNGKLNQYMNGYLTVTDFVIENTTGDIALNGYITVNGTFYKNNLDIAGSGTVTTGNILGPNGKIGHLALTNVSFTGDTEIIGDVTVLDSLTLNECELTVDGAFTANNSVTLNVGENSRLDFKQDMVFNNVALNIDGEMQLGRDVYLKDCTVSGGGTLSLIGDLINESVFDYGGTLKLNGKTTQTLSGSDITVKDLVLENSSRDGITFQSTVNYSGELTNDNTKITGEDKLIALQ